MNKKRILNLGIAWISAVALILAVAMLFQVPDVSSQGQDESALEADKALAAEQNPDLTANIMVNPDSGVGGGYPLFEGVDDANIAAIRVDVTNNNIITAFQGVPIWGAAYDYDNDIVYFNNGSTLWEWPVGGTPNILGLMVNGSGAAQALVSLAYYDGTLYGTKNIAPEAVHIINPVSLVVTPTITYPTTHDMGGLSIDRDTGTIYATDDGTDSLVIINQNGTVNNVTAYPAGETDVDGLAVGGGKAYMVTDDAGGNTYVYNLGTNMYEPPLTNPWPTSETFSAGAWIEQAINQPGIALTKTVGLDVNSCASTTEISVTQGTVVTYCYDVTNTGTFTLYYHDLVDSELGTILDGFFFGLAPGASAFLTDTDFIFVDTTNVATWTACNAQINGPAEGFNCSSTSAIDVVTDTAQATVYILPPSISLSKTVGTDPNACAGTSNINVTPGTDVTYCYEVTNTGPTTLTVHELDDSELGPILTGFPFDLDPGASVFVTQTTNITTDTVNVATWTACNIDGPPTLTCFDSAAFDVVSDTATANVTVTPPPPGNPAIALTKTVGLDSATCGTTDNLVVGQPSTEVYYCYTVRNTGDVTFTTHDLFDDQLGSLLTAEPYFLAPGDTFSFFPVSETITTSVTNVATWTAYVDIPTLGPVIAQATDSATVTEAPTDVSLNSFSGASNGFLLPVMMGLLALLVFVPIVLIRRLQVRE